MQKVEVDVLAAHVATWCGNLYVEAAKDAPPNVTTSEKTALRNAIVVRAFAEARPLIEQNFRSGMPPIYAVGLAADAVMVNLLTLLKCDRATICRRSGVFRKRASASAQRMVRGWFQSAPKVDVLWMVACFAWLRNDIGMTEGQAARVMARVAGCEEPEDSFDDVRDSAIWKRWTRSMNKFHAFYRRAAGRELSGVLCVSDLLPVVKLERLVSAEDRTTLTRLRQMVEFLQASHDEPEHVMRELLNV